MAAQPTELLDNMIFRSCFGGRSVIFDKYNMRKEGLAEVVMPKKNWVEM